MFEGIDIRTRFGEDRFDLRSCGILLAEGQVLVSVEDDATQTLPGGAVKTGESAAEAVVREFKEESGLTVEIVGLVAILENFFQLAGENYHQILFVYQVSLPDQTGLPQLAGSEETMFTEWLDPMSEKLQLKPAILNQFVQQLRMDQSIPLQHLILREEG